jgi:hypothetical protein
MRRWFTLLLLGLLALGAGAQTLDYRLRARELAPGVYVVEGANADFSPANGCNIINTGFIVGDRCAGDQHRAEPPVWRAVAGADRAHHGATRGRGCCS